ncbi:MAG TPA: FG-GAP-like repeat-containing protein [Planctomycetota bacterium]|nr:FG-GAP-like repeat-containing protein [Planctomycetota bacterium]
MIRSHLPILLLLLSRLLAQEQLWEVWPTTAEYGGIATLGDFDHDGYDDLIAWTVVPILTAPYSAVRILSGRDGSILQEQPMGYSSSAGMVPLGDMDQDGYPDYAITILGYGVAVWSPHRSQTLWHVSENATTYGWVLAGNLDVNGDGRNDLLVASSHPNDSRLWVYDNSGILLYSLDARPFGYIIEGLAGVGDLDGDGCDDFVVGCSEPTGHGTVVLFSGRTGTPMRQHFGPQVGDAIGHPVVAAGDMDGDGVMDYAAGSTFGFRGIIEVFSGATGNVLHLWTNLNGDIGHTLICGRDLDLDGVIDVVSGSPGYYNSPQASGRVLAYSGRDEQLLWEVVNPMFHPLTADSMADLGVQPGNPYPVVAYIDWPNANNFGRIRAVRASLPGTAVVGIGCSSSGNPPAIGLRAIPGFGRLQLSGAPAGALAPLLLAPAALGTYGGYSFPLALDPFGLPGCSLLVPPIATVSAMTGSVGFDRGCAAYDLPRGLVPSGGLALAAQWVVLDPATLGFSLSPRHEFRVQ